MEIGRRLETLRDLQKIVPEAGLTHPEDVAEEMNDLISEEFEPYFSGNAALHLSATCQRCGRCCNEERTIAISFEDCRTIAGYLGISLKRFMMKYTRPHELARSVVGNARMVRKERDGSCPFYNPDLPGCEIHPVKPQVCSAAYYLSKMNLLLCEETRRFSTFAQCPSDVDLRARMRDFIIKLRNDPEVKSELARIFQSSKPEIRLFHQLLRLKGFDIYFGRDKAMPLVKMLGLKRMPEDEELRPAAFLYAAVLLEAQEAF
ncbi:MAG: Flagellin N-methylase [Methanosaeta sp. PtaB.Bin018]|nr:YkgJ family cysteine cluster protein [Methanothrix sp.]OPX75408.1 MAG: Flagellin N-methylase [Methanosaeta sp. PtaB.Bin018]OPY43975.1 MAG: Flagellin N-methylase [Methanosaeta sp. PtaU1.Bin016]